jgi:hypothetical protein
MGRNGQESGIVVRGGRVTLWRTVKAFVGECLFELIERRVKHVPVWKDRHSRVRLL